MERYGQQERERGIEDMKRDERKRRERNENEQRTTKNKGGPIRLIKSNQERMAVSAIESKGQ